MWTNAASVLLAAVLAAPDAGPPTPATPEPAETSGAGPAVGPGATVRFFSPAAGDWRTGTVLATRGPEWQLRVRGGSPVWIDVGAYPRVEVLRRTGPSVAHGIGLGLLVGLVVGGTAFGYDCPQTYYGRDCHTPYAMSLGVIGGGIGAAVASVMKGERWVPIERRRPAAPPRVTVHPVPRGAALRVAVSW